MNDHRIKLSLIVLIAANLVPLVGVFAYGWNASVLVFLYWMENLIVGSFNILRIATAKPEEQGGGHALKLFLIPFFCIHFGIFCAVHGSFLVSIVGIPPQLEGVVPADIGISSLFLPSLATSIAKALTRLPQNWVSWTVLALVVSHGFAFIQGFILGHEFEHTSPAKVMFSPYIRIVILHIAILATGMAVHSLGSPAVLLAIIVVLKVIAESVLYLRFQRG